MEKEEDIKLKCVDCGSDFIIESGEREFYRKKGLYLPKRCPSCRRERRLKRLEGI